MNEVGSISELDGHVLSRTGGRVNRFGKSICAAVIFFAEVLVAQSAEQSKKVETPRTGIFQVNVNDGYLSLVADRAPLAQIFEEIGKQARITIETNISPEEKITKHLDRVPLEDGIRQLAKNVSVFYAQDPKTNARRIVRVVVLSEVKGMIGQTKTAPPPEKINEPAAKAATADKPQQAEPSKFQFDPTKSTTNQTGPKQP
jgi:hypothetical protein